MPRILRSSISVPLTVCALAVACLTALPWTPPAGPEAAAREMVRLMLQAVDGAMD